MKQFLAWLFGWPLVYTKDYDGGIRLRKAVWSPFGEWVCGSIAYSNNVILRPNGRTSNRCYVSFWVPANEKARRVIPRDPEKS